MRHPVVWFSIVAGVLGTLGAPAVQGDPLYRTTKVTFNEPVEIPGMVLGPGSYVMKLLDPLMDRHIVRFDNADQSHMYAMVFTVPDYRLQATDRTVITFEERGNNAPQAIKEWFPAGENWGEQFVYAKPHPVAAEPAPAQLQPRAFEQAPAPVAVPEAKPVETPAPVAQAEPKEQPIEIAQATPPPAPSQPAATVPEQTTEPAKELPKTASEVPLLALIGAMLVSAGIVLRRTA